MLQKEKQMLMDCILMIIQMKDNTLLCLLLTLTDIVQLENGLLNLKMKLFLLSLAHKGHLPPSLFKDTSPPPGTPPRTPLTVRKPPPADETRAKREALAQPPHRRQNYDGDDDEDENKENHPIDEGRKGYARRHLLQSLLERLEEDLQVYQEEVLRELNDLRQTLGIPQ
uniref:E4 protein n=1 Tax=Human papillomavirus TaxID=10566 RepID=A0A385PKK4_9PAPI|nr:MAG: E4 protein [Human papillomavirus]